MIGKYLLATAGVALALSAAPASASTIFDYTGSFQSFTASTAGTYHITAAGAQGGTAYGAQYAGGLGAQTGGDFTLAQGEMLTILVGGMGGYGGQDNNGLIAPPSGGGGGGSFVYTTPLGPVVLQAPPLPEFPVPGTIGYVPLAIAGGGGGAANGEVQQVAPTGGFGYTKGSGINDFIGNSGDSSGGPGASFYFPGGAGGSGMPPDLGGQGGVIPPLNLLYGPDEDGHGGFGGGGGGGQSSEATGGFGGGGGGGGYDGGDGGILKGGGGGYSFLADGTPVNADYQALSAVRSGNGFVSIDFLPAMGAVPESATWAMMIVGFGVIGFTMRRRQKTTTRVQFA